MPLFISDEEYALCSHDPSLIAQKADTYIRQLQNQLDTEKAQYDASSITAEQTCSLLEQKYVSLKSEFVTLQSQFAQLSSSLEERVSEIAQIQAEKHQIQLQSIGKDGEIERLSMEASELQKAKSELLQLIEHKDLEINEKNSSIKGYLDKIVALTDSASSRESRISELEAEHAHIQTSLTRLTQEKELVERHNVWLNDELTTKVNSLSELRKVHNELEADTSFKLADLERKHNDTCDMLNRKDDKVKELESKLEALQNELRSSKDTAAAAEEQLSAELATVNKLVELYKESSDEWSKKCEELEGVIKALETHTNQVEKHYKQQIDEERSARIQFETEVSHLKEKLEKCEAELESYKNSDQLNILQMSSFRTKTRAHETNDDNNSDNLKLVPSIPEGISGTALAASLLRDGWSLVKMYEQYQEAVDALRHEQLGRKQSQAILERVLHEIEAKAEVILDERAEHERTVEAYNMLNEKLQHLLSEQTVLERTIRDLKAELKKHERDYNLARKENDDLQKQVAVLLKECHDTQLRCGPGPVNHDSGGVFADRMLSFNDINSLVEQNVQLRTLSRLLTEQIEAKETELKENFEKEFQELSRETASKVNAVSARAEEQAQMIDSLHNSVAMYKKLYEEELNRHIPQLQYSEPEPVAFRNNVPLLLESSRDASAKQAQEQAYERIKLLEEETSGLRSEIIMLKSERDKSTLEAGFAREKLDRFMKDFDRQRDEMNGVIARNVEFSQLIVDYQRKIREASESLQIAEDLSRKLNMEVSVLKREKELLLNSEKRAMEEVRSMSERVHQLQATLNTIQSTEEAQEESRSSHRMGQEEYLKRMERDWAEAQKELQQERDHIRQLRLEHESSMRGSMVRIEEMGKELADALRAVSDANTRASVAEERLSRLEKLMTVEVNDENDLVSNNDTVLLKEEIEKLRVEAQSDKDHMLQYKRLAQVNEIALKEMEIRYERFKSESENVKKTLEDEIASLKEQVKQLQDGYNSKEKEAVSAAESQEQALTSSLSEIYKLREEITAKTLRIEGLESQLADMKDELEKEHQRWRTAQDNYERQVVLQSETIQELTKTSQDLAIIMERESELRKLSDFLKTENLELKSKWETEKSVLEDSKDKAEKKFNEVNEQNKILLDQLEALHIKLAEKSHGSGSGAGAWSSDDGGLQNVVKYLRRSKEIAETEISLLKQEKLRLQAQLEGAMKAESEAQALLRAERENSRSVHFTEDEFKALQVQVREMNLLRESNVQLREENRLNFEECEKLRESNRDAKMEVENMKDLLVERQNEVEACKREIELLKKVQEDLEARVRELVDRFKDMDPEEYVRMRTDFQQMNVKMFDKDKQLELVNKLVSEKQDVIIRLEQDLGRSKAEIDERESKLTSVAQIETSLKSEVEKLKRLIVHLKRKCENLAKEKEEMSKKNIEPLRSNVESSGEHANREREEKDARIQMLEKTVEKLRDESREKEEKDTRIQMLEKTIDRLRDEVKRGKDEIRVEKAKNLKTEKDEKSKLTGDVEKHRLALKTLSDEVEKLKNEGDMFDDLVAASVVAVENFEHVAHQLSSEFGLVLVTATDTPLAELAAAPPRAGATATNEVVTTVVTPVEESAKAKPLVASRPKVEPRKVARRLVRPRIVKPEQPKGDAGMSEASEINAQSSTRKRPSTSEEPHVAVPSDVKKPRGSEPPREDGEVPETATEESPAGDETQAMGEDDNAERDDVETGGEEQAELQNDGNDVLGEENVNKTETETEDHHKVTEVEHAQSPTVVAEGGSEPEEGEMASEGEEDTIEEPVADVEMGSPLLTMEDIEDKHEEGEIEIDETTPTPESSTDKKTNDEAGSSMAEEAATDHVSATTIVTVPPVPEKPSEPSASAGNQDGSVSSVATPAVVTSAVASTSAVGTSAGPAPEAAVDTGSTTINLNERARQRSLQRLAGAGAQPLPPVTRGRGRVPRGRTRGGRTARGGQTPGSHGN